MRHDDDRARGLVHELLQPVETGEVQVVGRLVEQQDVEAAEQDRRERGARRLPAREHRDLDVEPVGGQAEIGAHRADARVEVVAAEREELLERVGVGLGRAGPSRARP